MEQKPNRVACRIESIRHLARAYAWDNDSVVEVPVAEVQRHGIDAPASVQRSILGVVAVGARDLARPVSAAASRRPDGGVQAEAEAQSVDLQGEHW